MKTSTTTHRFGLMAAAASVLAVAALAFAGTAQARDNLSFSIGISSPGAQVGINNGYPVYVQPQPVYVQPQPVYVRPRPVYVQPVPGYYSPRPVYVQPVPVYPGYGYHKGKHKKHHGYYHGHGYRHGYNQQYAPVYYDR